MNITFNISIEPASQVATKEIPRNGRNSMVQQFKQCRFAAFVLQININDKNIVCSGYERDKT